MCCKTIVVHCSEHHFKPTPSIFTAIALVSRLRANVREVGYRKPGLINHSCRSENAQRGGVGTRALAVCQLVAIITRARKLTRARVMAFIVELQDLATTRQHLPIRSTVRDGFIRVSYIDDV